MSESTHFIGPNPEMKDRNERRKICSNRIETVIQRNHKIKSDMRNAKANKLEVNEWL